MMKQLFLITFFLYSAISIAQNEKEIHYIELYANGYNSIEFKQIPIENFKDECIYVRIMHYDDKSGRGGFEDFDFDFLELEENTKGRESLSKVGTCAILSVTYRDKSVDTYHILGDNKGTSKENILYKLNGNLLETIYRYFPRDYYTEADKKLTETILDRLYLDEE